MISILYTLLICAILVAFIPIGIFVGFVIKTFWYYIWKFVVFAVLLAGVIYLFNMLGVLV